MSARNGCARNVCRSDEQTKGPQRADCCDRPGQRHERVSVALSRLTNGQWQDRGARWGLGISGSVACRRERGLYRPTVWPCASGDTCTLSPRVLLQGVEVLARPCRSGREGWAWDG